jgi:hypothetical protein
MTMPRPSRLLAIALPGLAAVLLASCGSSGKGLIPEANAGPLRSDFEAVASAAAAGNGSCASTERELGKTEHDFLALPAGVDAGLRNRLKQGISNLRLRALSACTEPSATATTTNTQTSATTQTAPTTSTSTSTQPPTHTASTPSSERGGGTPAEESGSEPGEGKGRGDGEGKGVGKENSSESEANSGGTSAGGGH